jgi:thymidine kinase
MAKLHFKYGAMNSGKSDTLIKTAYNYIERGLNVATIKPAIDTKGDDMIVARAGLERQADILATPELDIQRAVQKLGERAMIHCALVDEAQFLEREQINQLYRLAKDDDISVVAFGLRTDFQTNVFPGSLRLLEVADAIEKLPTMCGCNSQAEFNTRKINDVYVFEGSQVAIDGEDTVAYDSLCGTCYVKEGGTI